MVHGNQSDLQGRGAQVRPVRQHVATQGTPGAAPMPQMLGGHGAAMTRDLVAQLARLEEHLSLSIHEQTTQRAAVREALTRLRTGESPDLVAARLEDTCPEMLAHHMGRER